MYIAAIKKGQKKEEKTKRYSLPQTDPNQSMKSIMDNNLSPINSLVQVNKLHKNKYFSLWIESSTFSKNLLFLIKTKTTSCLISSFDSVYSLLRFLQRFGCFAPVVAPFSPQTTVRDECLTEDHLTSMKCVIPNMLQM